MRLILENKIMKNKTANSKSGKKSTGKAGKKELSRFKEMLIEKRRSILGDMSELTNEISGNSNCDYGSRPESVEDVADYSSDHYELDVASQLLASERNLLREIDDALERIENGTYGICEGTGRRIKAARLEAIPWARHCIEYAMDVEKQLCI